jgi:hypothetical protein
VLFYPSVAEGLAWLVASDESWGDRAYGAYLAAVERGEDETAAEEDGTP